MSGIISEEEYEFTTSELNFYTLLKAALLLDCEHIMEWDCLQLFGHTSLLKLTPSQQTDVYYKSRKAVICELERSNDPALMRAILT
jgi:uncharacterized protein YaiE (UPF0345 family)